MYDNKQHLTGQQLYNRHRDRHLCCPRCKISVADGVFGKNKRNKDGLATYCKTCANAINKVAKQKYCAKPEILVIWKKYRDANKERINALNRVYKERNIDKVRAYDTLYNATENGKAANIRSAQKRRSIKAALPATLTIEQWNDTLEYFGHCCAYCLKHENEVGKMTQEHMQPVSRGGGYTQENIVPACRSCNCSKGSKTLMEWAQYVQ